MALWSRRRATAALIAAVLITGSAASATPAAAAGTGVIAGHVTATTGAPAAGIQAHLWTAEPPEYLRGTTTDADGGYAFGELDSGRYLVGFDHGGRHIQIFHNQFRLGQGDPVTVSQGRTTTVDERLLGEGVLTGRFVDRAGAPLVDSTVYAVRDDLAFNDAVRTGDDGSFALTLPAGSYIVSFVKQGLIQSQYVPGKLTPEGAQRFVVSAGGTTTVADTALPTGSISGHFTDDSGASVSDAWVIATVRGGERVATIPLTDSNGEFSLPDLIVGTYTVAFETNQWTQYFDGELNEADADPVTVADGRDTRVDDNLLPTGNVRIRAVDAVTGATIRDFCANACSDGTGRVLLTGLPQGRHEIYVSTDRTHFDRTASVDVRGNRTLDLTVRLRPAALITTTVVDRATGRPLAGVCLTAYEPKRVTLRESNPSVNCSDAAGKVTVGKLESGPHRLFADPVDDRYGRQWVAAGGGSGDERAAATVNTTTGRTVAGPPVRVDRAGSIRGRVTDAATGAPLSAGVGTFTQNPGAGTGEAQTDADGLYRIDGLGPYRWPLAFMRRGEHADAWTGGAVSRYASAGTPVTAGGVATADIGLTHGVAVRGTVSTDTGVPVAAGRINVVNAETGDYTGTVDFSAGAYELRLLPGQEITFRYEVTIDGRSYTTDRAPLPPETPGGPPRHTVAVPAAGLSVDLVVDTTP